jgi:hypothetical protein
MPNTYAAVVPVAVQRRLLLALVGYRWDGARYQRGDQSISEQQLDAMDEAAWEAFLLPWLASAVS